MSDQLKAMLIRQEGVRLRLYQDSVQKKLTIGVGRNIEDVGISLEEAHFLLDNDIMNATIDAQKLHAFTMLDPVRQDVLVDMVFNMGLRTVQGFTRMLAALEAGNWNEAAAEMRDSHWATQVGNRAIVLANMVRTGVYA